MAKISVYSPGASGVNVDADPILLQDQELRLGQNAYHDPTKGHMGAIRKRPGLGKFSSALGDTILGGITMPEPGTGGAPAPTGTNPFGTTDPTGDSTGTGDGTGAPGATFDGGAPAPGPAGAGAFTGSSIFAGARLIALGRANSSSSSGGGWYLGPKGLTSAPNLITTPGPPLAIPADPALLGTNNDCIGPLYCIDLSNQWTYYQIDTTDGTTNTTAHTIRRTNGGVDIPVATIPSGTQTGATTNRFGAQHFHAGSDGFIYLTVHDNNVSGTSRASRLMRLDPSTFTLVELTHTVTADARLILPVYARFGTISGTARVFYGSCLANTSNNAPIYVSDATGSTFSADLSSNNASCITCFEVFNGRLFTGFRVNDNELVDFSLVASRDPSSAVGAGDAWTTDQTISTAISAPAGTFISSMKVWRDGNLYIAVMSPTSNTAYIFKVVASNPGDPTSVSFTWTQVFSSSSGMAPLFLWTDPADPAYSTGYLYAIGGLASAGGGKVIVTTDGTSWTTRTGLVTTDSSLVGPVFVGMQQT